MRSALATPAPGSYQVHLTPDHLKVTWVVMLFSLALGATMIYVPYEFQANTFYLLYPYIRWAGLSFFLAGITLSLAYAYPQLLGHLNSPGRLWSVLNLLVYWYTVAVVPGSRTGLVLYPVMALCLVAECLPRFRQRGFFPILIGLVSITFGLTMLLVPNQFSSYVYRHLQPVILQVGTLYLLGGVGVLIIPWRRHPWLRIVLFAGLAIPFVYLAIALGFVGGWSGMEMYTLLAIGCVIAAWSPWVMPPVSVRWRLLRGFVIAGLIPLVAMGGMASYLAQRIIEEETRVNAQRGIIAEANWLSHYIHESVDTLRVAAINPVVIEAIQTRNKPLVNSTLESVHQFRPAFSSLGVLTSNGDAWVVVGEAANAAGNYADRDLFTGAVSASDHYISKPFFNVDNKPVMVISIPIRVNTQLIGIMSGALRIDDLKALASLGSENFPVQVVDRREEIVLRGANEEGPLKTLDPTYKGVIQQATQPGVTETAGNNKRFLIAYAPVEGTDWVVLVSQPISQVYRDITQLSMTVIGVVALAGILAMLLSQFVAREVTHRVAEVQGAARALAAGDLNQRVNIAGADELADLGKAFNEMADQIQAGQTELARVNTALQSAVRVRDDFISVASHEMKTPLTPIKGFSQSLLRQLERTDRPFDREQAAKALRLMNQQADRLTDLVNDLLDTSRIRSGRFVLNRTPMDLVALCREVIERFNSQIETESHTIGVDAQVAEVWGEWDIRRLDQVITNLISNALQYSPAGGSIQVTVAQNDHMARVAVCDHGIGIPAASLPALFQPFYRAPNTLERFGGLGLGLYISREIVERHGGRIWADSPGPGLGSRFYVELPHNQPKSSSLIQTGTIPAAPTSTEQS